MVNIGSCKQLHAMAQALQFSDAKDVGEISTVRWGRFKSTNIPLYHAQYAVLEANAKVNGRGQILHPPPQKKSPEQTWMAIQIYH